MSYYVHFQISWNGGEPRDISSIAKKYISRYKTSEDLQIRHAFDFFSSVASEKAYFGGEKGSFWSWGKIGNSIHPEDVLKLLSPFFKELYENRIIIPSHRIIAFCEPEQTENVQIYQLSWDKERNLLELKNFTSKSKWFWGQM